MQHFSACSASGGRCRPTPAQPTRWTAAAHPSPSHLCLPIPSYCLRHGGLPPPALPFPPSSPSTASRNASCCAAAAVALPPPELQPPPHGLCGLPGVTSPELLRAYWKAAVRPRLDSLLRTASMEPPGLAYLGLLDSVLSEMRNAAAPARHAAACHVDGGWRHAAEEVGAEVAKYETFVFQAADDELLPKLQLTAQRLAAQLKQLQHVAGVAEAAEADAAHRRQLKHQAAEAEAGAEAGMEPVAVYDAEAMAEAEVGAGPGNGFQQSEEQQQHEEGRRQQRQRQQEEVMALRRHLRLCGLLRRSLLRGGAGLEDDGGLERMYAVRTAPSGAQDRLSRLLTAEREAVAAVSTAVATGPGRLAVPLRTLRQALLEEAPPRGASTRAPNPAHEGSAKAYHDGDDYHGANPGDEDESGHADQDDVAVVSRDALLGPMLAAAQAAGVPISAVGLPLTPVNLRTLLRSHPCSAIRRTAYEYGLLPRTEAALGALGRVAAVRSQVAAVMGYDSFAEYSYSRAGLAVADGGTVAELLQALAETLLPAAEAELQALRRALAVEAAGAGQGRAEPVEALAATSSEALGDEDNDTTTMNASTCSTTITTDTSCSSSSSSVSGCSNFGTGSSSSHGGTHPPPAPEVEELPVLAPWDVEYAQARLMTQRRLPPEPSEIREFMNLYGVLYGLSDLLYELMGVRFQVEGREVQHSSRAGTSQAKTQARAAWGSELWGPRVVRLTVWSAADMGRGGGDGSICLGDLSGTEQRPTAQQLCREAQRDLERGRTCVQWHGHAQRSGMAVVEGTEQGQSMRLAGVVYLDPGNGYGTRQLRFPTGKSSSSSSRGASGGGDNQVGQQQAEQRELGVPAVAVGLQWQWRDGMAESPAALHELLHEMGHALHLTLAASSPTSSISSTTSTSSPFPMAPTYAHFGGLQLPLDALEAPSSLLQTLAYDPAAVARICRPLRHGSRNSSIADSSCGNITPYSSSSSSLLGRSDGNGSPARDEQGLGQHEGEQQPQEEEEEEEEAAGAMAPELASRVAAYLAAENCGALGLLHRVLASLVDQMLHSGLLEEQQQQGRGGPGAAVTLWQAVREAYGAVPGCTATLRELAALPAVAHHQATFHSYLIGLVVASTARLAYPPVTSSWTPLLPPPPPQQLQQPQQPQRGTLPKTVLPDVPATHAHAAVPLPVRNGDASGQVLTDGRRWDAIRRDIYEAGAGEDAGELLERWLLLSSKPLNVPAASGSKSGDLAPSAAAAVLSVLAGVGMALVRAEGDG